MKRYTNESGFCSTELASLVRTLESAKPKRFGFAELVNSVPKPDRSITWLFVLLAVVSVSCGKVTFNMSGADTGTAKTCQVSYFENRADIINPRLSAQMTDALKDKIQASTTLKLVNSNADVAFEGEITGYTVQAQQVTASGTAAKDRLTVTVKVKFTNTLEADKSFDKSFSRFQEYTAGTSLNAVEGTLVDLILKDIMEDIFNEAFSSW